MNKRSLVLMSVASIVIGLCGGVALCGVLKPQAVRAQSAKESRAEGQRWEHCSLVPVNSIYVRDGKAMSAAIIYYVRGGGLQQEKVEVEADTNAREAGAAESSATAKALGKLGDEGWEMVGEGTLFPNGGAAGRRMLYFRRLKS